MPEYETKLLADVFVKHTTYYQLQWGLARKGRHLMSISQGSLYVTDEASYAQLKEGKTIAAVYRLAQSY
jgi:hypothetical protein